MIDTPVDPAATPKDEGRPDENGPDIAADDAGASALAEKAQEAANDDETPEDGEDA